MARRALSTLVLCGFFQPPGNLTASPATTTRPPLLLFSPLSPPHCCLCSLDTIPTSGSNAFCNPGYHGQCPKATKTYDPPSSLSLIAYFCGAFLSPPPPPPPSSRLPPSLMFAQTLLHIQLRQTPAIVVYMASSGRREASSSGTHDVQPPVLTVSRETCVRREFSSSHDIMTSCVLRTL